MLTKAELNRMATLMAKMEKQDFDIVAQIYKNAQRNLQSTVAQTFKVGDTVTFNAKGRVVEATVLKVNRKTIKVKENKGADFRWSVSPTLLKKV